MNVDTNYDDLDHFFLLIEKELRRHGFTRELLCETSAGPVTAWTKIGTALAPRVYLSSGMHGDEPAGPHALLAYLQRDVIADCHWLICPMLNPTGYVAATRDNAMGIDMNRDYVQRLSPEVGHHAAWLLGQPVPQLFLSLHEDWEATGFYFYEINLGADLPARAAALLSAVEQVMQIEPLATIDDHPVREKGWIYHEAESDFPEFWPEAIFLAKCGCPLSYTFETPSQAAPLAQRIAAHLAAIDAALAELFRS